jgi:hypothetical protein
MPSYLHACRQFLLQVKSRYRVIVALLLVLPFPWSRRSRGRSQVTLGLETQRALEWQRVDALLESLRRLEV